MASVGMVSLFDERSQRRMTKQQTTLGATPVRTGGYDLHRLTKIGHQDQENVASLTMSLNVCCKFQY